MIGEWLQLGQNIIGEETEDYSGRSVSINAAVDRVVIGAPFKDVAGNANIGVVKIYQLSKETINNILNY